MYNIFGYISFALMFVLAFATARYRSASIIHADGRIGCIDGLRGILALAVVGAHFPLAFIFASSGKWETPRLFIFQSVGAVAVICFFMITAMLFYRKVILDRRKIDWFGLYKGRVFRLLPAYVLLVISIVTIASFMTGRLPSVNQDNIKALVAWLTFTLPGPRRFNEYAGTYFIPASVTWTLRYEWLFYASLPFFALVFRPILRASMRVLVISFFIIIVYISRDLNVKSFSSQTAVIFLFGMLVAEVASIGLGARYLHGMLGSLVATAGLCASFCFENYSVQQTVSVFLFFLPIALGNNFFGILSRKEAVLLGDASYSIYLFHGVVLFILVQASVPAGTAEISPLHWLMLPIAGAITAALSMAVYAGIEKPFIEMGKSRSQKRWPPASRQASPP